MAGKHPQYSTEFEAPVALETLRGELTTVLSATEHDMYQTMVGEWKRQATNGMAAIFSCAITN